MENGNVIRFLDVENFEKKRIKLHKNFTGSY